MKSWPAPVFSLKPWSVPRFLLNHRLVIGDEVFRIATELRARHRIKTPDALHLATAMHYGCCEFWTNDDRLNTVAEKMAVNVLAQAAP